MESSGTNLFEIDPIDELHNNADAGDYEAELVDVSRIPLADILAISHTAIGASVARMLKTIDNVEGSFGCYNPPNQTRQV